MGRDHPHRRRLVLAVSAAATVWLITTAPGRRVRRRLRPVAHRAGQRLRYGVGVTRGIIYRQSGGHPAVDVDDPVLADRVRSELGRVEKRLDIPHVHVMVDDHVVMLHGDVPTEDDRRAVEQATSEVAGVEGVESYLHVGLLASDSRPSEGRVH